MADSAGDEISIQEKSRKGDRVTASMEAVERRGVPAWLELNKEQFAGKVVRLPVREDTTMPINEQLVVELYSK